MCGRFTLTASGEDLAEAFDLDEPPTLDPRYNIAPSQEVVAIVAGTGGRRLLEHFRWGFVPARGTIARPLVNARAEGAWNLPLFAEAIARRRCLLPADGFYEWQVVPGSSRKQPHHIRLAGRGLFALGAIWQPSAAGRGTVAILTTAPSPVLRPIHDRMPVIVGPDDYAAWLDPTRGRQAILPLLGPYAEQALVAVRVGAAVNHARVDSPICIDPSP